MLRHIINIPLKINNKQQSLKILIVNEKLWSTCKETMICFKVDFLLKAIETRRDETSLNIEMKKCQYKILYSAKIPLKNESKIKGFSKRRKWKEFISGLSVLKEISVKIL